MAWWLWIVLGIGLAVMEAQVPTNFFVLGFGVGALAIGALVAAGAIETAWVEWLGFSIVSVAVIVVLQRLNPKAVKPAGAGAVDDLVGEIAIALEDLVPGAVGKAELRGTPWTARNGGGAPLAKGERGRVERVEGLTIWIRAESGAEGGSAWKP